MFCMRVLDRDVVQTELAFMSSRAVEHGEHTPQHSCEDPVRCIAARHGCQSGFDDIAREVILFLLAPVDRVGASHGPIACAWSGLEGQVDR